MRSKGPWTRCRAFWMLLAVVLLVPALASAQTETGRISGTAMDEQGGVLPGATVTIVNTGTGVSRTTVTDSNGRYAFTNLQPGTYEVAAELTGFAKNSGKVIVPVGAAMEFNPKLGLAGTTETIQVVSETPAINVLNAEQSTTVSESQIRELPTLTRNVYDLVGIAGNVASDDPENTAGARGTGYSINGMRSSSTNVLLDGAANNDEFDATVGQAVPLDSVQEFSVITNNFSAQYGRATGGIVNVATKSGTNTFRGSAYEFFRNEKLAANTYDNTSNGIDKGKYRRDQSGFSIGGPVMKDKLHFFSSLEYIRVRSADTQISWVPTPQFIAASGAATQSFFNAYGGGADINGPVLTRQDVSDIVGAESGPFNNLPADLPVFGRNEKSLPIDAGGGDPQDNYQWVNRVDYSVGPNSQLYVRYAYQNQEAEPGTNASSPYAGFDTGYLNKNHNLLGSFTRVFSPTFTAQSKVVWNRIFGDQPLNGDPQPTLYMNPTTAPRLQTYRIAFPGYLPWNPGSAIPFGGPQKLLQLYQDQTWIKGRHDFRFGGSYVHINDDRTFGAYANSVEALNTSSAVLPSLDNFVLGQIARYQTAINPGGYPGGTYTTPVSLPSFFSANRYDEFAFYLNDNWRLGNRFTVNLGLRYEYYGPQKKSDPKYDSNFYYGDSNASVNTSDPVEMIQAIRTGQVLPSNEAPDGTLWKSDWNNWAPRVGFAWDLRGDGKTSVRGGYGIAYERNFGNVTYNVLFNPPDYLVASLNAGVDIPTMPIYTDPAGPFGGVAGVTKTIPPGSLRHIDQNIETAYAHFYGLSYQHEIATNLVAKIEYSGSRGRKLYDLADPNKSGAPLVYLGVGGELERPTTQYGAFNTRGNRGQSEYNGVQFSLESRRVGNTGLQFNGAYTYGRAYDNLSTTFSDSGNNFNLGYLDAFDPMLDWGFAQFDVRHRVSLSGIWQVPFFSNGSGVKRALLGDWQVAFLFNARTGLPFTVYDCTNGFAACMRMEDPVGIDRNATSGDATENPNEFKLIDLSPVVPYAGGYVHPVQGTSDFGPYPSDMTKRDAFRGPGFWNVDATLSKRIRFADRYAVQFRFEAYNLLNHANMFVDSGNADISSFDAVYGYRGSRYIPDQRRLQLGLKFEF